MYAQSTSIDYIPVPEFFEDKSIFVTGGTGFIGKLLVEKLVRSCPAIKNVYLLIRPKKNQDINSRLADVTNSLVFDKLREERPNDLKKILPIKGDLMEPELGISKSDQNLLIRTVSIVFHSAAIVKFNEPLKLAITVNVLATKRMVDLIRQMSGLKAFIYLSSAFCQCDKEEVKEIVYPTPYDPEKILDCVEWMDDKLMKIITPTIIGDRPNTYLFSKALAEQMLMKESGKLPIAIMRPTIVVSSMKEPVPGWVDNWSTLTGLAVTGCKGIFKTFLARENCIADIVPVDIVVNLLIVAAWKTATTKTNELEVYNCGTGMRKPITWGTIRSQCIDLFRQYPSNELYFYPSFSCTKYWFWYKIRTFFLQLLPAYLIDASLRIIGKNPIMIKIQNKLDAAGRSLAYFTLREWRFYDDHVQNLNSILSSDDRQTFYFDVKDIDWPKYLEEYYIGVRSFVLKENLSTLPTALKRIKKLFWIHCVTQLAGVVLIWKLVHVMIDFSFSL